MHLDNALGNRKAEAGAALLSRVAVIDLLEFLKNAGLMFRRDARPRIAHNDLKMAVYGTGNDVYRSRLREFDGVAGQIQDHLAQSAFIATSEWQAIGDCCGESQSLCPRQRLRAGS